MIDNNDGIEIKFQSYPKYNLYKHILFMIKNFFIRPKFSKETLEPAEDLGYISKDDYGNYIFDRTDPEYIKDSKRVIEQYKLCDKCEVRLQFAYCKKIDNSDLLNFYTGIPVIYKCPKCKLTFQKTLLT